MAKFLYKMQNILNIKLRLETQAKTVYAEKAALLEEEENKMRNLLIRNRCYEEDAKKHASEHINIPELRRSYDAMEVMKELIKQQAVRIRIAQKNLDHAREQLNQAMQERKVHEKLKEKAFEDFKLEINAEEKKEIDELVSFNYNDNNKEAGE